MFPVLRIAAIAAASLLAGGAAAHDGPHPGAGAQGAPAVQSAGGPAAQPLKPGGTTDAREYFTDTILRTQDGNEVRFFSDVLRDRVVVLNVIYTSCKDACPMITHKLGEVRNALGESARGVHFVSISSDPETDTPAALKKFARANGADDRNWIFLTGTRANVELVLARLGQLSSTPQDHSTLLIAGDVRNKRWSKIRPDAPAPAIAERLRVLVQPAD